MKQKSKNFRFKTVNLHKFSLKHKIFAFFLILSVVLILYVHYLATPIVIENTRTQLSNYATRSINAAIAETMNQNLSYGDLVTVGKNASGDVAFIEANSVRINILSKSMSRVVMSNFLEFAKRPIHVSIGAFTGIPILTGVGPKLAYNVSPYGEVFCDFLSNFESAGINQTLHKIFLVVSIKVNVVFPFKTLSVSSESQVLLCESLIVGKIPEVFLNSNNLTDMLNLVPEKFSS